MRLTELNPMFLNAGGDGIFKGDGTPAPPRTGVGLYCACPCGQCGMDMYVPFSNPLDGGPPLEPRPMWLRTGETFETLTLTPSILRNREKGGCGWHGFITNGEVAGQVEGG